MRIKYAVLWLCALAGCAPEESFDEEGHDEEVGEAEAALTGWDHPRLKWVLFGAPGSAKLATFNVTTNALNVIQTHTAASQFRAVGASGNKLLWQSTSTGALGLWTLNASGAFVRSDPFSAPTSAWRAVSIVLSDANACPAELLPYRTYVVTFEGPEHPTTHEKEVRVRLIDDHGVMLAEETLPQALGPTASARGFYPALAGEWGLLEERTAFLGNTAVVTLYARSATAGWVRLRTENYSPLSGITACTEHSLPPPGVNWRHCPASFADNAAGSGHSIASFGAFQGMPSESWAQALTWTKTDGTAKLFGLEHDGPQLNAAIPLNVGTTGYTLVSVAGYDDSAGYVLSCDHSPGVPVGEPPDLFGDLDVLP
jgi:hypothetical protein